LEVIFSIQLILHGTRSGGSISKLEGHCPKGALLYMIKIERFYVVHEPNKKFLKIWSLYNVENGLYRVFTTAKKGTFFPAKDGVHSKNTFSVL
jgi:hypothetical protein